MKVSLSNNKSIDIKAKSVINKNTSDGGVAGLEKQKKVLVKQKKNYMKSAGKNGIDPKTVKARVAAFDNQIKNIDKQISAAKAKAKAKSNQQNASIKTTEQVIKIAGRKADTKAVNSTKATSKMDMMEASVKQLKALSNQKKSNSNLSKELLKNHSTKKVEQQINSYRKNASFLKEQNKTQEKFSVVL